VIPATYYYAQERGIVGFIHWSRIENVHYWLCKLKQRVQLTENNQEIPDVGSLFELSAMFIYLWEKLHPTFLFYLRQEELNYPK